MIRVYPKLESDARFVARWQDYLSEASSGDLESAGEILEKISHTDEFGLIPRSEILARVHRPAPARAQASMRPALKGLLDGLKTLDDVSAALDQLTAWSSEGRGPHSEIQLAITTLTPLDRAYREFKAGLSTNLEAFLREG